MTAAAEPVRVQVMWLADNARAVVYEGPGPFDGIARRLWGNLRNDLVCGYDLGRDEMRQLERRRFASGRAATVDGVEITCDNAMRNCQWVVWEDVRRLFDGNEVRIVDGKEVRP